jgi:hypothetical protein
MASSLAMQLQVSVDLLTQIQGPGTLLLALCSFERLDLKTDASLNPENERLFMIFLYQA